MTARTHSPPCVGTQPVTTSDCPHVTVATSTAAGDRLRGPYPRAWESQDKPLPLSPPPRAAIVLMLSALATPIYTAAPPDAIKPPAVSHHRR
jgi:hypothetical protein